MRLRQVCWLIIGLLPLWFAVGCGSKSQLEIDEISASETSAGEKIAAAKFGESDWPWWRGPNRNGIASTTAPTTWNEETNIEWKVSIPGRGHSSPTVLGEQIFLATADDADKVQSVLALDRKTGKQLWKTDIHKGSFPSRNQLHGESTNASCTIATDGERLFVAFLNNEQIVATALDLAGKQLWQKPLGPFDSQFGYAPSPVIHDQWVIFAGDNRGGGFLAALHRKSGDIRWLKKRPAVSTYSSPTVAKLAGKDQLLISGANKIVSYDPSTGDEIWSCQGTTDATCGTVTFLGDHVFASGGFPGAETLCIRADGSGEAVWRNKTNSYVPSMVAHEGHLYLVTHDQGIAWCWEAATGKMKWKQRLGQGPFRGSLVLANGNLYIPNTRGSVFVFRADPTEFRKVAENRLGDECFSTPTICGGKIYLRVADSSSGQRRETLYCIAEK